MTRGATHRPKPTKRSATSTKSGERTTEAQREARRRESLRLVMEGMPISAVADKLGVDVSSVSRDYRRALADYYGPDEEEAHLFRVEVTERQRYVIACNMGLVAEGDPKAAAVVTRCDSLIADIWGLKSATIRQQPTEGDELARMFEKLDAMRSQSEPTASA